MAADISMYASGGKLLYSLDEAEKIVRQAIIKFEQLLKS